MVEKSALDATLTASDAEVAAALSTAAPDIEEEILEIERIVAPLPAADAAHKVQECDFSDGAKVYAFKWLGYTRKNDVTDETSVSAKGTVADDLFFREVTRYKLLTEAQRIKLAKTWGKTTVYNTWRAENPLEVGDGWRR